VTEYTVNLTWTEQAVVDNFFESLKWRDLSGTDPVVDLIAYGDLMRLVDFDNRWIYKGSLTTPPCSKFVYWNVLRTVYPITKRHVD
jgi:hypothetical protein